MNYTKTKQKKIRKRRGKIQQILYKRTCCSIKKAINSMINTQTNDAQIDYHYFFILTRKSVDYQIFKLYINICKH